MTPPPAVLSRGDLIALIGTSTRIFDECRLPNGALIDAPIQIPSYPADAPAAGDCTPGVDLPLAMLAMDALNRDVRPLLTPWLIERAQGVAATGQLLRRYHPHGLAAEDVPDPLGTAALLLALQAGRSTPSGDQLVHLLGPALADASGSADDGPHLRALRCVADRLRPDADAVPARIDIALRFLDAAIAALQGDRATAMAIAIETMAAADRDGHFPAWLGDGVAPRPMLRAHLAFLIAVDALGEVAALPKSGYTGRKR